MRSEDRDKDININMACVDSNVFNEKLQRLKGEKRSTSGAIGEAFGQRIVRFLKGGADADAKFKFYVREKGYALLDIAPLNLNDVLVVPYKPPRNALQGDSAVLPDAPSLLPDGYRRVAFIEEFYDIIHAVHVADSCHNGIKKTFKKLTSQYAGIPRSVVEDFVALCQTCHQRKIQTTVPPLQPILSNGFMKRLQVDLISMQHMPDRDFNYIFHAIDHWTRFNFLAALPRKDAASVRFVLEHTILPYFGPPKVLHSDNGREFVNQAIQDLLDNWPGRIQVICGRPRHPPASFPYTAHVDCHGRSQCTNVDNAKFGSMPAVISFCQMVTVFVTPAFADFMFACA